MSSDFDIQHIAKLARLTLSDEEQKKLGPQLAKIVEYIDQMNQLDTTNVEPTSHVLPIQNVFREDQPKQNFPESGTDLLSHAPKQDKGHYEVPQIIG